MSRPSSTIAPLVASCTPAIALSSVDLPAPLVPRSATISPSSTSKSTPNRTCTPPSYTTSRSRTTSILLRPDRRAASATWSASEAMRELRMSRSTPRESEQSDDGEPADALDTEAADAWRDDERDDRDEARLHDCRDEADRQQHCHGDPDGRGEAQREEGDPLQCDRAAQQGHDAARP